MTQISRSTWVRALTAHPPGSVIRLAAEISQNLTYSHKSLPQEGLSMLKMQDTVFGEAYYLGEFPLSSAWIEMCFPDGRQVDGSALVMSDSTELALALAICDGVLAHGGPRCADVMSLVEEGMRIREQEGRVRNAMLAKTLVNFSVLSSEVADD
jgi:alpha-D-ribose 1-methylphosphonate 5-triphosphate synthase subunit PhnG